MERREFDLEIMVNGILIRKVIIDSHYEKNHKDSITDEIILSLVSTLDGQYFEAATYKDSYKYFVTDQMNLKGKSYKLIWLLEDNEIYIGVINAYRRN
ncbi:hypothetical protein N9O57_00935 [bacterium]|nr:hypothetical protein [bacterium]